MKYILLFICFMILSFSAYCQIYSSDVKVRTTQGNVGIGTDAPSEKLDVKGNIVADSVIQVSNIDGSRVFLRTRRGYGGSVTLFDKNGAENLVISGYGPSILRNELNFFSDTDGRKATLVRTPGNGGNFHIDSHKDTGDSEGHIYLNYGSDRDVRMLGGGGNLAIGSGVFPPSAKVEVRGNMDLKALNSDWNSQLNLIGNNNNTWNLLNDTGAGNSLRIRNAGTGIETLTLQTNGNIAIAGNLSTPGFIYGILANGAVSNLNTAWTTSGNSIANGFQILRYSGDATNKPIYINNANWLMNIYSHQSGGTSSYGHQLAGADSEDIYFRRISNGSIQPWHKLIHTGNISSHVPASHSHDNKAVLDGIAPTNVINWNKAFTSEHTHENKSILDDITQANVNNWNNGVTTGTKFHSSGSTSYFSSSSATLGTTSTSVGSLGFRNDFSVPKTYKITFYIGLSGRASGIANNIRIELRNSSGTEVYAQVVRVEGFYTVYGRYMVFPVTTYVVVGIGEYYTMSARVWSLYNGTALRSSTYYMTAEVMN